MPRPAIAEHSLVTPPRPTTIEGEVVADLWVSEAGEVPETTILIDTGRGVVKADIRGDAALRAAGLVGEGDRVKVTGYLSGERRIAVTRFVRLRRA